MTKEFTLPMDITAIQECLPHRHPFLFVDRVTHLVRDKSIQAIKCISISDPILQGHFPGMPIFPGVLIVEGVAQAAGILGQMGEASGYEKCLLTEISKTRFRRQVVPGDVLVYDIKVKKMRAPFYWFEAEVRVGDEVVAQVELSALLK